MLEMKTAISKILYQELGEGNPERAHERIYVSTMKDVGFDEATVSQAPPFEETRRLVQRYREASGDRLGALGFVYGTEVADLAMVSGIGNAVRRVTGAQDLPWVDIHILQEPDHVEQVNEAIEPDFTDRGGERDRGQGRGDVEPLDRLLRPPAQGDVRHRGVTRRAYHGPSHGVIPSAVCFREWRRSRSAAIPPRPSYGFRSASSGSSCAARWAGR